MARSGSVRNYAIEFVGARRSAGGSTVGGGNAILETGQHAHDGTEHTGLLPLERISTAELDDTLVAAPDGAGGIAFRAETGGIDPFVPYFIDAGETFTVPEFKQALFAMTIEVDPGGTLAVDGFLLEVD